jgi:hypothetical protein
MTFESFMKDYYAPILATIVGLVQLVGYIRDRKPKILVEASIGTQLPIIGGRSGEWEKTLFITITNLSRERRIIERPQIIIKENGKKQYATIVDFNATDYPKSLSPGEPHTVRISIKDLSDLPPKRSDNVRFMVRDTFKKKYKSKSLILPK